MDRQSTMDEDKLTIWTIGHSTRTLDTFIRLLTVHKIEMLADVRRFPASRKHRHFNRDALAVSLPDAGIEYMPLPELGGLRRPRPRLAEHQLAQRVFPGLCGLHGNGTVSRRHRTAIGNSPLQKNGYNVCRSTLVEVSPVAHRRLSQGGRGPRVPYRS